MKKMIATCLSLAVFTGAVAGCSANTTEDTAESLSSVSVSSPEKQKEQTNMDKALALIHTFATGDTETARTLLDESYIQHNLAYGTGEEAFIDSVEYLASAEVPTTVENIRSFEDGDYVFLQTVYNFAGAGEQVAFDIFRFDEDGEIGTTVRFWLQKQIRLGIPRLMEPWKLRIWTKQKKIVNWLRISCMT